MNEKIIPFLLFITILILFVFTNSKILSITHDSALYLVEIVNYEAPFHPHHLIYHKISELWLKLISSFGGVDAMFWVSFLNSIFGTGGIVVFYKILKDNFDINSSNALWYSLLPVFSFGYWLYSVSVEVYIMPIFFILTGFYYLISPKNDKEIYLGVSLLSISVLFHQVHFILVLPLLSYLIFGLKLQTKKILQLNVVFFGIFGISYLLVLFFVEKRYSIEEILYWLTYYNHAVPSWNETNAIGIFKVFVGIIRSVISVYPVTASDLTIDFVNKIFGHKSLEEERYLFHNFSNIFLNFYFPLVFALFIAAIFYIQKNINLKKISPLTKQALFFIIPFLITYGLFFSFWDSDNMEFWIAQSVLFWLLVAILSKTSAKSLNLRIIVALLFSINFFYGLNQIRSLNNDYHYSVISDKVDNSNRVYYINDKWIRANYVEYFFPGAIQEYEFTQEDISEVNNLVQNGNLVFISKELLLNNISIIEIFEEQYKYRLEENEEFFIIFKEKINL